MWSWLAAAAAAVGILRVLICLCTLDWSSSFAIVLPAQWVVLQHICAAVSLVPLLLSLTLSFYPSNPSSYWHLSSDISTPKCFSLSSDGRHWVFIRVTVAEAILRVLILCPRSLTGAFEGISSSTGFDQVTCNVSRLWLLKILPFPRRVRFVKKWVGKLGEFRVGFTEALGNPWTRWKIPHTSVLEGIAIDLRSDHTK